MSSINQTKPNQEVEFVDKKEDKKEHEKENKKEHEKDECAICMDNLNPGKNFAKTNCGHSFCLTCLVQALKQKNTCPLCRAKIEEENPQKNKVSILTLEEGIDLVSEELDIFAYDDYLDAIRLFDNPGATIKSMLRVFSIGLIKSVISHQEEEDDEEASYDDEDIDVDSDGEEEEVEEEEEDRDRWYRRNGPNARAVWVQRSRNL